MPITRRTPRNSRSDKATKNSARGGKRSAKKFTYKKRDAASVKKRASQGASDRDQVFKNSFKILKLKDDNNIRLLPPTWDDAENYALDIYIHYGIGPDDSSFLCLDKLDTDDKCPICEERAKAEAEGDADYSASLRATKRPTCYVIDRDNESEGPLLWAMPWTVERDLAVQSFDKRSGEVIPLDDPYEGFDISFSRHGKGRQTKYIGLSIGRRPSDAADDMDAVLEYIQENPIPDTLEIKSAEYIGGVFAGHSKKSSDNSDVSETGNRSEVENLSWEDIHKMSFNRLENLIEDGDLDDLIDIEDYAEDVELAEAICQELGLKKTRGSSRDRNRSRAMREGSSRNRR